MTTRLGLASDLHLDFEDINPEFFNWRGDILLLAGDLGEEDYLRKHAERFFDRVAQMAPIVLMIAGNHEFYGSELVVAEDHLETFLEQWNNIVLLRNRSIKVGDLEIFGATMWTDYHGSPLAAVNASLALNDFKHIRYIQGQRYRKITPAQIIQQHHLAKNALLSFLENGSGLKKVVMTHHAPSMQSVPNRYKHDFETNKAYCNAFEGLIMDSDIKAWVHGHTHDLFNYNIGETRVLCNPRGYPGERPAHLAPYMPLEFEL